MEITFSSNKLKKILEDKRLIYQNYNKVHAEKIMMRITELMAADNLADIPQTPPPRRHKLEPLSENRWGIDYSKNFRIVIEAQGDFTSTDLTSIKSIKILSLEDYH